MDLYICLNDECEKKDECPHTVEHEIIKGLCDYHTEHCGPCCLIKEIDGKVFDNPLTRDK